MMLLTSQIFDIKHDEMADTKTSNFNGRKVKKGQQSARSKIVSQSVQLPPKAIH